MIFIDEIDAVRSLPFSADEFFAAIRECHNRRSEEPVFEQLTFCLLGVATPSDVIQDTRVTPFNIGRRIELQDFRPAEATLLLRGLGRPAAQGAALLKRVLYWTGGHPYLTQRLCRAIAEDPDVTAVADVDRLCRELFSSARVQERDDNLLFVRERLIRSEVDRASLLDLYARVRRTNRVLDDETSPLVAILRLSGIVRSVDGRLRVRNRNYECVFDQAWVQTQMPDAELRRQQAAFRRGLLRAATASGAVLAVVAGLAFTAMHQARRADQVARQEIRQRRLAEQAQQAQRRHLYGAQMNLAQQALEVGDLQRAQELLEAWRPEPGQEDLRGFEWRYLWRLSTRSGAGQSGSALILTSKAIVSAISFDPIGHTLATGTRDGTVQVWDTASRQVIATLKGHRSEIRQLVYSPDGKTLASVGDDRTVKLWTVSRRRGVAALALRRGVLPRREDPGCR